MILLAGIRSEPALTLVAAELDRLDLPVVWFDQREASGNGCALRADADGLHGTLQLGEGTVQLEDVAAVYTRLMDDRFLPELRGLPADAPARLRCRELHNTLVTWLELAPGRIMNRGIAMSSNTSKPYQSQLIRTAGFDVPETLVTNDPELVRRFAAEHGRVIYKSISGTRSIVRELDADALARLDDIRWCPVQFQAYVEGVDVRVHVVGSQVFATRVSSTAADYRYAVAEGTGPTRLQATRLSEVVEQCCVDLTAALGLRFSGIDLRITPTERVVCFEVNPCPAYPYYQSNTGQPIARAVAHHLAGITG